MQPKTYVIKLDKELTEKLLTGLESQGFEISKPPYTLYSGKKKGISCTLYTSGKLVIQGKGMQEFIEFFLEPQILGSFQFTHSASLQDKAARIGVDESGKGDFFGPLCIAGVQAGDESIQKLTDIGVRDSKRLTDDIIVKLGAKIEATLPHYVVKINPPKYNELYKQFQNLNHLLAWGHATVIETLVQKTGCNKVIIDQFANERVVENALQKKNINPDLTQRHRGEEDIVVAAASILARKAFVQGMDKLSKTFDLLLPKGASPKVIAAGKLFVQKYGEDALNEVGKLHFQTLNQILGRSS